MRAEQEARRRGRVSHGHVDAGVATEGGQSERVEGGARQSRFGHFPVAGPTDEVEPDAIQLMLDEQALQRGQALLTHAGDGGIDAAVPPFRLQGVPSAVIGRLSGICSHHCRPTKQPNSA